MWISRNIGFLKILDLDGEFGVRKPAAGAVFKGGEVLLGRVIMCAIPTP
jgi:hypothetical protein